MRSFSNQIDRVQPANRLSCSRRFSPDSLRRRFEQNQEDCTYTVLELLPAATANIVEAMNTEQITYEIQQMKASGKSASSKSTTPPSLPEATATEDDGKSAMSSLQSETGVHASQAGQAALPSQLTAPERAEAPARLAPASAAGPKKTKRQLWGDLTTSCTCYDLHLGLLDQPPALTNNALRHLT